ncbi:MAG: hypothetical protein WC510_07390 [Candidatus Omnitrophota bacterium]
MRGRLILLSVLFSSFMASYSYASFNKKPELRWQNTFRYDTRGKHQDLYISRLSGRFTYNDTLDKQLFKLEPFFESRLNTSWDIWERYELGCEIGKDIFPWFYIGQTVHQAWVREDYKHYSRNKRRDYTEARTRILFSHDLFPVKNVMLKGFALAEYNYDLSAGAGVRNEVAIGTTAPLCKNLEATLNWRHVDRIHDFDTDNIEISATLIF